MAISASLISSRLIPHGNGFILILEAGCLGDGTGGAVTDAAVNLAPFMPNNCIAWVLSAQHFTSGIAEAHTYKLATADWEHLLVPVLSGLSVTAGNNDYIVADNSYIYHKREGNTFDAPLYLGRPLTTVRNLYIGSATNQNGKTYRWVTKFFFVLT